MMDLRLVAKLVTSEGLTSRGSLGQLVDDSRLQASFEGDCTIYQRPNGQKERWKQDREPIGNGRYGSVFLQRRVDSARYGPQVRAVKIVDVRNHKGSEKPYEKELELIAKFSQSKVGKFG
jgi:hypothetical protein